MSLAETGNQNPSDITTQKPKKKQSNRPTNDDRRRMRLVMDTLILHIHPAKVPERTLRFTYTWGLGGLSAFLLLILVGTGILLEMNYTPSPTQAYQDIINLRTNVWFGELIRNLHHWSANLLIVAAVLHMLRVVFTGSFRKPRHWNWWIGLSMLLLILGANFTGYLLPWDQLAYWAITVGTSIVEYIPLIGPTLNHLLLGGPEVSAATLLNFYALHISIIPISIVILMSYHFWRIRKDGGVTIPKSPEENELPRPKRVTTIPNLVSKEVVFAIFWLFVLTIWAIMISAPLEGIANPDISPNPAKAPWYFLGLQELLLHFHPIVAGVIIPVGALFALALLPYYDLNTKSIGIYFRSYRGRFFSLLALGLAVLLTPAWIWLDESLFNWLNWFPNMPGFISNGLFPLGLTFIALFIVDLIVLRSHKATREERVLFWFIFMLTVLSILTITGIFFRGPGMELFWPWNMPVE
jgi:quinol-cytochrome oxidoreductase complex cytochrome b subunit